MDAAQTVAAIGILAVSAPAVAGAEPMIDLVSKAGPSALLALAVIWLHRELQAERERCATEYKRLHGDIVDVRAEGERRHEECREELENVHQKLLGMIEK